MKSWCSLAGVLPRNIFFLLYFHPPFLTASFSPHLEAWVAAMFCLTWIIDVGAVQKAALFPSPKWNHVGQGGVWECRLVCCFLCGYSFRFWLTGHVFWLRQRRRTLICLEVSQAEAKAQRNIVNILHSCRFSLLFSLFLSQLAVCMGTPILTPLWIYQAWARREDMWVTSPETKHALSPWLHTYVLIVSFCKN